MNIGIVGTGRMGRVLAQRLRSEHSVVLYDSDPQALSSAVESLALPAAVNLIEMDVDAFMLVVPDSAVPCCFLQLAKRREPTVVYSVATNVTRTQMAELSSPKVRGLNVKIIGHAGEMSRGAIPVILVDQGDPDIVDSACHLFGLVGKVVVGEADNVGKINMMATQEALKAAVALEEALYEMAIDDANIIRCALSHVAPGVMRAYAENDLGPFARQVVCRLRDKS